MWPRCLVHLCRSYACPYCAMCMAYPWAGGGGSQTHPPRFWENTETHKCPTTTWGAGGRGITHSPPDLTQRQSMENFFLWRPLYQAGLGRGCPFSVVHWRSCNFQFNFQPARTVHQDRGLRFVHGTCHYGVDQLTEYGRASNLEKSAPPAYILTVALHHRTVSLNSGQQISSHDSIMRFHPHAPFHCPSPRVFAPSVSMNPKPR